MRVTKRTQFRDKIFLISELKPGIVFTGHSAVTGDVVYYMMCDSTSVDNVLKQAYSEDNSVTPVTDDLYLCVNLVTGELVYFSGDTKTYVLMNTELVVGDTVKEGASII